MKFAGFSCGKHRALEDNTVQKLWANKLWPGWIVCNRSQQTCNKPPLFRSCILQAEMAKIRALYPQPPQLAHQSATYHWCIFVSDLPHCWNHSTISRHEHPCCKTNCLCQALITAAVWHADKESRSVLLSCLWVIGARYKDVNARALRLGHIIGEALYKLMYSHVTSCPRLGITIWKPVIAFEKLWFPL